MIYTLLVYPLIFSIFVSSNCLLSVQPRHEDNLQKKSKTFQSIDLLQLHYNINWLICSATEEEKRLATTEENLRTETSCSLFVNCFHVTAVCSTDIWISSWMWQRASFSTQFTNSLVKLIIIPADCASIFSCLLLDLCTWFAGGWSWQTRWEPIQCVSVQCEGLHWAALSWSGAQSPCSAGVLHAHQNSGYSVCLKECRLASPLPHSLTGTPFWTSILITLTSS